MNPVEDQGEIKEIVEVDDAPIDQNIERLFCALRPIVVGVDNH